MKYLFAHPHQKGLTYWQHCWHALKLSYRLAKGSALTCLHAVVPCWFETAATDTVVEIHQKLK